MDGVADDAAELRLIADAKSRILSFYYNREDSRPDRLPESGLLFHYTSAEGLKGIVENNELWASSAYFLNDSAEITYGYGVLREVLERWVQTCKHDEYSLTLGLARDLLRGFGHDLLNKNLVHPIYLACFCEDGNLLSQWRAYGQSGGYSLAFKFFPFIDESRVLRPESVAYTSRLIKVEYERAKQLERCKLVLDEVLPYFDDPEITRAVQGVSSRGGPGEGYSEIYRIVADVLMEQAVAFKDKAFEAEREWRTVVRRRELLKQGIEDGGRAPVEVYFRPARGLLIPYVKLTPASGGEKIPLELVRSGPTIDRLSAVLSLHPFLCKHGFNSVGVRYSGISARF